MPAGGRGGKYGKKPVDWEPLSDVDPVPGDPSRVAEMGIWCRRLADQLTDLSSKLSGICTDEFWKSAAGQEFGALVTSVASRAMQASYRFLHASDIYGRDESSGYALDLWGAQNDAKAQLLRAQDPTYWMGPAPDVADPPPPPPDQVIGSAKGELARIIDNLTQDAVAAAAKLNWVTSNDGLADGGSPLGLGQTEDAHFAALADARALDAVLHGDNPSLIADVPDFHNAVTSQEKLEVIVQDALKHQNDPGFLQEFFSQTGSNLGGLARTLTTVDNDRLNPLDPAAQKTLGEFAALLAAATKSNSLYPGTLADLSSGRDAWSMAMLLKFGPNGTAYGKGQGAELLGKLTQNVEHQIQPDGYIPHPGFPDGEDPLTPVLTRAAENGEAARLALGDGSPLAIELAHHLIATQSPHDYSYQGDGDGKEWRRNDNGTADGNAEANFLVAAGLPPSRDGSDPYSLPAALNVFSVAADIHTQDPHAVLLDPVRTALQSYSAASVVDLALSTSTAKREILPNTPLVSLGTNDVKTILDFAYGSDNDAWEKYRTGILNQAVDSLASEGGKMPSAPLEGYQQLTALYGVTNDVQTEWAKAHAIRLDQAASNRLALANAALGAFGNVSFDGADHPSTLYSQPVAGGAAPLLQDIAPSWFKTNNVDGVTALVQQTNENTDVSFQVLAARALLKSGTLDAAHAAELAAQMPDKHDGDTGPFLGWYGKHEDDPDYRLNGSTLSANYSQMQQQFDRHQHA